MKRSTVWAGILAFSILFCLSVSAWADVTIRGKVEYWDKVSGSYKPAKNIIVKVQGNWMGLSIATHTDNSGSYRATQRNPYFGSSFTINIDAYAATPEPLVDVYSWWGAWYPYKTKSAKVENVKANQTVTIDLRIGGNRCNVASTWSRSKAENANAFLVHQEILDFYNALRQKGFPESAFGFTEVIVPAAGVNSYYNHVTGNINLVLAGATGAGSWENIPNHDSRYVAYPSIKYLVRHEASHAVHHKMAFGVPLGLNMPAIHSPEMETNRYLAFTEGFAYFLPLVTINSGGRFDLNPTPIDLPNAYVLAVPVVNPPNDHYAWEGEVTALLWDLYNPSGGRELIRHPAMQSADGTTVPMAIVRGQTWTNRLSDNNMARIRRIISDSVGTTSVCTIGQFLDKYQQYYPNDLHALKTIAFNRSIMRRMPAQNAPYIDGNISINRIDNANVEVSFKIIEPDAEDRPFIEVFYWRAPHNQQPVSIGAPIQYGTGWSGNSRQVTQRLALPAGNANDRLWIVVSDGMLPTAYVVASPAALGTESDSPLQPRLEVKPPVLERQPIASPVVRQPALRTQVSQPIFNEEAFANRADVRRIQSREQMQRENALRDNIRQARQALRAYADAQELAENQDRALLSLAQELGELPKFELPERNTIQPRTPGVVAPAPRIDTNTLQRYNQWLSKAGEGQVDPKLSTNAKSILQNDQRVLDQSIAQLRTELPRARELSTNLGRNLQAINLLPESDHLQTEARAIVQEFQQALNTIGNDTQLIERLQQQNTAVKALIRN